MDSRLPTGNYTITVQATLQSLDTGTITTGVAGGTSTRCSIQDTTKTWTTNQFRGKQVLFNSLYREIVSNDVNTLYLSTTNNGTPSGTYTIYDYGATITKTAGINITQTSPVNFNYVKFYNPIGSGGSFSTVSYINTSNFNNCYFLNSSGSGYAFGNSRLKANVSHCFFELNGNAGAQGVFNLLIGSDMFFRENHFLWTGVALRGGTAVSLSQGNLFANYSNTYENLTTGMRIAQSTAALSGALGYSYWTNMTTGIRHDTSSVITFNTNNQVFSNVENPYLGTWSLPESTIQGVSGNASVLNVGSMAGIRTTWDKDGNILNKGSLVVNDRSKIGELEATHFGNGEFLDNVVHRYDSFIQPSNPCIGCIFIDEN